MFCLPPPQSLNLTIWAARNVLCRSDNVVVLLAPPTLDRHPGGPPPRAGEDPPPEVESAAAPLRQLDAARALLSEFDGFLGERAQAAVLGPRGDPRDAMLEFVERGPEASPWAAAWWPLDLLARISPACGVFISSPDATLAVATLACPRCVS